MYGQMSVCDFDVLFGVIEIDIHKSFAVTN